MFTGIIEATGTLVSKKGNRFTFSHPFKEVFPEGESIAISGMCATVLESTEDLFTVEIIEESRRLTIFEFLEEGSVVNLERSAVIGQRNSGHNVQGHIDERSIIVGLEKQGDYQCVRVEIEAKNRKLLVHKGSVAVDGISLTVSKVSDITKQASWFEVSIISHTWENTTLQDRKVGDRVNVEYDVLGKYALQS